MAKTLDSITYHLFNETDQILAHPRKFASKNDAEAAAEKLRGRFKEQGYYLTAQGTRISPDEVRLVVIPAGV